MDLDIQGLIQTLSDSAAKWIAEENEITQLPDPSVLCGANPPENVASLEDRVASAKALWDAAGTMMLAQVGAPTGGGGTQVATNDTGGTSSDTGVGASAPSDDGSSDSGGSGDSGSSAASAPLTQADITELDWRSKGGCFVTDVRNQGQCGSCVAFGSCAACEATYQIEQNDMNTGIDFSEAALFFCVASAQGRTCATGWWVDPALTSIRDDGLCDEACFPYDTNNQTCAVCDGEPQRRGKIQSFQSLTSLTDMRDWLVNHGPLVTCFTVYQDFMAYKSGVYKHVSGTKIGGHCVCVVGWDDANSCWICKNSWGTGWGENGYFRIWYGDSGIDAEMWGVQGVSKPGPTS